jgi:hypothetical protein
MKWLFALLLAVLIFGGAALFTYKIFVRPEMVMRAERKAGVPARPTPDVGLPEFEAAKKLKTEGKLSEARAALTLSSRNIRAGRTWAKRRTCSAKLTSASCSRITHRRKKNNTLSGAETSWRGSRRK